MDNAQKAIMIGVGLFITIIIISAVLLITNLGTDLINNARNQMSNISKSLQNQVTSAFDGKTVTGSEVIAACQQYENSDQLSVMIYTTGTNSFNTGKYKVYLDSSKNSLANIKGSAKAGGVYVTYKENTSSTATAYAELQTGTKNTLAEIQDTSAGKGVTGTQTYYSYVMKDVDSDTVMGVLFVRKGI